MSVILGKEIQRILGKFISPLKIDLILSKDAYSGYLHFTLNNGEIEKNRPLGPYESMPLLRNLLGKCDLVSPEVREKLYQSNKSTICILHEWDENIRKAMLFDTEGLDHFDEKAFVEFFRENKEVVGRWFSNLESKTIGESKS